MYLYQPDEIDRVRAHHQGVNQDVRKSNAKRIGNLGELAFEQFCREYLPVEVWEWKNEEAIRRCNPESFSGHDFVVFGYEVDVKTSRDVSAFRSAKLIAQDPDDDIIVMVWHRDKEDALILLGWERTDTLKSKMEMQEEYSGREPEKLAHLAARPMNELHTLGPNTAYMNQKPENPFGPGDRVVKEGIDAPSVAVVIEVLPPEQNMSYQGHSMDGEAVQASFPTDLEEGPGNWREIHPAKLASYCDDHAIKIYTYNHSTLEFAENPFTPGDYVIKPDYQNPDLAYVANVASSGDDEKDVGIVFLHQLNEHIGDARGISPDEIESVSEAAGVDIYRYRYTDLKFKPQY